MEMVCRQWEKGATKLKGKHKSDCTTVALVFPKKHTSLASSLILDSPKKVIPLKFFRDSIDNTHLQI